MKKHFVIFCSPGTLTAETSEKSIKSWNVDDAIKMSLEITERHGATPYGFYFITRERKSKDLDSKVVKNSGMYYLGGKIETLEEIKAKNNPEDKILISNMECNGYKKIVTNYNSYKWTQPLFDGDIVLNMRKIKENFKNDRFK